MSHLSLSIQMPFKVSNSLTTELLPCKGIVTLKSHFPRSHEEKLVKNFLHVMYNKNLKNLIEIAKSLIKKGK